MIQKIKNYIGMVLGPAVTAVGISLFLLPNKILTGGVSGISTILYHAFGFEASVSLAIMNFLLLLAGSKILGKTFTIKTLISAGFLSVFVDLAEYIPPLTNNIFLAALFGACLYGGGIAITFVSGSSTAGTDIVGRLVQYFLPHMQIGKLLMLVDGTIIAASFCVFRDFDLLLVSIVALIVSTCSIDYVIQMLNISKLVFVISEQGSKISQKLISTSPRGVTKIEVWGEYTNERKSLLLCALKNKELTDFKRKIREIDPSAFIILAEAQQIDGNGFSLYH